MILAMRLASSSERSFTRTLGSMPALPRILLRRRHADPVDVGERDLDALLRGRSTPAIRAILTPASACASGSAQMMRTTPWRRTTLHFTQIFRTDDLTFTFRSSRFRSLQAGGTLIYTKTFQSTVTAAGRSGPGRVVGHQLHHHRLPGQQPQQARRPRDVGRDLRPLLRLAAPPGTARWAALSTTVAVHAPSARSGRPSGMRRRSVLPAVRIRARTGSRARAR